MSKQRNDRDRKDLKEHGFIASVSGVCENWWFKGLANEVHTPRVRFSNAHVKPDFTIEKSLTRSWRGDAPKLAVPRFEKHDLVRQGWIAISLTIQQPELVSDRKIPVLYYPFRKDEICYGDERAARKIAKTIRSSTDTVLRATLLTYPMISSLANRI